MKKILFMIICFAAVISAQNYRQVKINLNESGGVKELNLLGLEIDHAYFDKRDNTVSVFLNDTQFNILKNSGFGYQVLIENWNEYYNNLPKMSARQRKTERFRSKNLYNVQGFDYGSMGGYLTYDEIQAHLDTMRAKYPNLISAKSSIGQSYEGRDIFMIKISDNPDVDEDEPEVLYDALTHAREPEGMMTLIYYMYYLLENYGVDPEVTYLIDNREMYFVPVINPDGYEYNRSTNPNGGGMWRKNRRLNDDASYGVDLNRNYGFKWGYDDNGSSPETQSEVYRGAAAFSEPETQAIRDFCNAHNFMNALNYHTYSNLLIMPWGYKAEETPDSLIYRQFGKDMTAQNHYTWGISDAIIYGVNGDSDDWMYGEQSEKNKILAMTPEVGSGADGFWPRQSRILPLAMENVRMNLYLAWAAGGFVGLTGASLSQNIFNPGDSFTVTFFIRNKGLGTSGDLKFNLISASEYLKTTFNTISIDTLKSQESDTLKKAFTVMVTDNAPVGALLKFALVTTSGNIVMSKDTLGIYVGNPTSVYYDDCSNIAGDWSVSGNRSKKWTVTENDYYSEPSCFTDSKIGNYSSGTDVKLESVNEISLKGIDSPRLSFWTKYDIESGWDYGQTLISSDNGANWKPVSGALTKPGGGDFQPSGEPVYDGNSSGWVREEIDLTEYAGQNIKIKFELKSDSYVEGDGWYIDDINIFHYTLTSVEGETGIVKNYSLGQNYPNPFNPSTTIKYQMPKSGNVKLIIYDMLGREVKTLVNGFKQKGRYKVQFDASKLSSGIYFYHLESGDFSASRKLILLK